MGRAVWYPPLCPAIRLPHSLIEGVPSGVWPAAAADAVLEAAVHALLSTGNWCPTAQGVAPPFGGFLWATAKSSHIDAVTQGQFAHGGTHGRMVCRGFGDNKAAKFKITVFLSLFPLLGDLTFYH